jgi:pimeloyl-ACP methyl ester carboxylesterase
VPYATNGDVRLYYETFGDPADPTLLLINGLGSQCINYKEEWCRMFVDKGFHVIRFDNRDVGLSSKLDGAEGDPPYTLSEMAADALAVLDDAGVERAHAMGLSMGGMIVQKLAIEHPGRLLSMTSVMSTTGDPDVGQATPEAMAMLTTPAPPDRDGAIARHVEANRVYGSPAEFDEQRLRANAAEAYDRSHHPAGVARQMFAVWGDGSRTAALANVTVPALVLHGDQDRLIDISGGRRTAEAIPGARFVTLEGMGHDYPPAYWPRIVELVAEHAATAGGDERMPG